MSAGRITLAFGGLVVLAALGLGVCATAERTGGAQDQAGSVRLTRQPGGRTGPARLEAARTRTARVRVRASGSWGEHTPDRAFDGTAHTMWNAGDYAPQWIEADLGSATELATLVLHMTQLPAGETTHEVWVADEAIGPDCTRAKLVNTFEGQTDNYQRLRLRFPRGLCARHVQIRTTRSPSWVAWLEVELRVRRPDGQYLCRGDPDADNGRRAGAHGETARPGDYRLFVPAAEVAPPSFPALVEVRWPPAPVYVVPAQQPVYAAPRPVYVQPPPQSQPAPGGTPKQE